MQKRNLLPGILLVGAAGGGTGYAMLPDFWFGVMTFLGACGAGACVITLFGRGRYLGWGLALVGAVLATLGASATFGLAFNTRAFYEVPILVFLEITEHPTTLFWWLATMGAAHLVTFRLRQD